MPRLYLSNNRGRRSTTSTQRTPKLKKTKDQTYQDKVQKKRKGGAKYGAAATARPRRKQVTARDLTDEESTTSGIESAGEGEPDDDKDDDEPAVLAPSRALNIHEAGRYQYDRSDDNLSEAGETDSMFGGSYNPQEDEELESRLRDDNDDDYLAVDDISESDLDDEKVMDQQAKLFLQDMTHEDCREESENTSTYINHIEGMSAYGFGDDSDGTVQFFGSSQSSESGNETVTRRVRFQEAFPEQQAFRGFSVSPTMTRALLPSALPNILTHSLNGDLSALEESEASDETDSDLTDVDLPDVALHTAHTDEPYEDLPPPVSSPGKKLKPPPVGRFIDDGSQSAGILDSTGTMLLITNPQSLGEEFSRRYGTSAPPSPGLDFAEAVLGDNIQSPSNMANLMPDPMFSGLSSRANATVDGQTIGIPTAFFPPADQTIAMSAEHEQFDEDGSAYSDMDEGEHSIRIEDIVAFDTDSEDESPTSPLMSYDPFSSPALSHLTNGNVTAFRRNADPTFRAMYSSPIASHAATQAAKEGSSRKPKTSRKRKSRTDSPYSDAYYKGVTPVQRVSHPSNEASMSSPVASKRRRFA